MSATPSPAQLATSYGTHLIAVLVSTAIWGITIMQAYTYFTRTSATDRLSLRLFVLATIAIDTLHEILVCYEQYIYDVKDFGVPELLIKYLWTTGTSIAVGNLVASWVQYFYAHRIYQLSGRKYWVIPIFICLLSAASLGCSIVFTISMIKGPGPQGGNGRANVGLAIWTMELACDFLITITMIHLLRAHRSVYAQTNKVISKLVTYSLATGLLVLIFAAASLAANTASPDTFLLSVFLWPLVRLYAVSFLSILNSRTGLRKELAQTPVNPFSLSAFKFRGAKGGSADPAVARGERIEFGRGDDCESGAAPTLGTAEPSPVA